LLRSNEELRDTEGNADGLAKTEKLLETGCS
jgi:hypothetical protein